MFAEFTVQVTVEIILTRLEILTNVAQELANTGICNAPSDKPSLVWQTKLYM